MHANFISLLWAIYLIILLGQIKSDDSFIIDLVKSPIVQSPSQSRYVGNIKAEVASLSDNTYHGNVSFGTPKQNIDLMLDISTFYTWLCSSTCSSCNYTKAKFKSSSSSTYRDLVTGSALIFSSNGKLTGTLSYDDVSIGGLTIKNQIFILMKNQVGEDVNNQGISGRISLAPGSFEISGFPNIIDYAYMQQKISSKVFAVWLSKSSVSGELSIGSANSKRYTGSITYMALIGDKRTWQVRLDKANVTVSGKTTTVCAKGCDVTFSTYSPYFYGPSDNITALNKALGATLSRGYYIFDCSKVVGLPSVVFTLGGRSFSIKPAFYVVNFSGTCYSSFLSSGGDFWQLGHIFIKSYYSVFDVQNKRIGLATSV